MPNKDANDVPPDIDYSIEWITRDGKVIPYREMSTTHLENTYNMLERMVCDFVNKCANRNEELDAPEWVETAIRAIEEELARRDLKYAKLLQQDDGDEDLDLLFV